MPGAGMAGKAGTALVEPLHTAVPGRLRARVAGLYGSPARKRHLESILATVSGIRSVAASTLTGNVLVFHDPALPASTVLARIGASLQVPVPVPERPDWHRLEAGQVAAMLGCDPENGLSRQAARQALARHGANRLPATPRRSGPAIFLSQLESLPVALLGASAAISLATGGLADAAIIVGVILVNAAIGYVTETRAEAAIAGLTGQLPRHARVVRGGHALEVSIEDVAPGDLVMLAPGTHVPADGRIIDATHLQTDESALTGESLPASKSPAAIPEATTALAERRNMVYMGTTVTGGSGRAIAVATGGASEIGRIQRLIGSTETPETPLQRELGQLGNRLVKLSLPLCGALFGLGLLHGEHRLAMLKSAVSLAVAAIPEGLPTVATATLALGLTAMRRRKILIRRLPTVEALGSVQVICLDKTGTLTENRMSVVAVHAGGRRLAHAGKAGFGRAAGPDFARLAEIAALCSDTTIDGGAAGFELHGTATENALIGMALAAGIDVPAVRAAWPRIATEYRAEARNFMVTEHWAEGRRLVAVKGSPQEVLGLCRRRLRSGEVLALTDPDRAEIGADNDRMAAGGLRVLGFAYGEGDPAGIEAAGLVWVGLAGMADPLRRGVRRSIREFQRAGIATTMVTGDQAATALAVGRELGLAGRASLRSLDASRLDEADPALHAAQVAETQVFSRVSPAQKLKIVQALQRAGKVVAMTGDGINDGPALKTADVGIALGVAGTDVARRVADVVLEEDRLETIVVAIAHGRSIHANIRKAVRFLLTTNLSEIILMLGAVGLGLGQPLTPMQLLWINLLTDVFPGLALAVEPPEADVLKQPPRAPDAPIFDSGDFRRIAFEAAALTAGAAGAYAWGAGRHGGGAPAGSLAFLTLGAAQLVHAFSCRSERHGLFGGPPRPPNPWLKLTLGASFALQASAMAVPALRRHLGVTPPDALDLAVIGAGALLPLLVNEATKKP